MKNKLNSLLLAAAISMGTCASLTGSLITPVLASNQETIYGDAVAKSVTGTNTVSGNTIVQEYISGTGETGSPINFNVKCEGLYMDYLEPGYVNNPTYGSFSYWGGFEVLAPGSEYTSCTYYSSLLGTEQNPLSAQVTNSTAKVYFDLTDAALFTSDDWVSAVMPATFNFMTIIWKTNSGQELPVVYSFNITYTKTASLLSINEPKGFTMSRTEISKSSTVSPFLKQTTVFTGNFEKMPESLVVTVPYPATGTYFSDSRVNSFQEVTGGTVEKGPQGNAMFTMTNLEEGLNVGTLTVLYDYGNGENFEKGTGIQYTVQVWINDGPSIINEVEIDPAQSELEVGKTLTLKAVTSPEATTSTKFVWSTPTPDQISISSNGDTCTVTGLKEGTAIVMVTAGTNAAQAYATIKVVEGSAETPVVGSVTTIDSETKGYITETLSTNGVTSTVVQNSSEKITGVTITIPATAIQNGKVNLDLGTNSLTHEKLYIDGSITSIHSVPQIQIELPAGSGLVDLNLPLKYQTGNPATVAMIVDESSNNGQIIGSIPYSSSISIPLSQSATIIVLNNTMPFTDVASNSQYKNGIDFMAARGLMNYYVGGDFGILEPVTRGMLAQILYNIAGKPAVSSGWTVPEGAENWWRTASTWAYHENLMGQGGSTFYGDMTRTQLALVLYRMVGSPVVSTSILDAYQDSAYIPYGQEARSAWAWAALNKIMGDNTPVLMPDALATREQIAKIFYAFALAVPEEFK